VIDRRPIAVLMVMAACSRPYGTNQPDALVAPDAAPAEPADGGIAPDGAAPDGPPVVEPTGDAATDASVEPATPPASLIAWYRFEETAGGGAANSGSVGNELDGVVGAGAMQGVPGKVGKAARFNGSAQSLVTIATHPMFDVTTALTVEAWIRPDAVSAPAGIVSKVASSQFGGFLLRESTPLRVFAGLCRTDGICSTPAAPDNSLVPNTWVHLALTYNGTNVVLLINGTTTSSSSNPGSVGANTLNLQIGSDEFGGFVGDIDEVKIWTVVRTNPEICADLGGKYVVTCTP